MDSLSAELERARDLDVEKLADAIESIGFECTRCGACCTAEADDPHTATVFPDEVRELQATEDYDWRDVARPMPYGLDVGEDGPEGETFEWALQVDDCGDCRFYEERADGGGEADSEGSSGGEADLGDSSGGEGDTEDPDGGAGADEGDRDGNDQGPGYCTVHDSRPLVCRTYPFSVALGGTSQPMGEAVDVEGIVRAHECEGLGRTIGREDALDLAAALKRRAIRELEEAIAVSERYEPAEVDPGEVVVHDSEGAKRPDGTAVGDDGT